MLKKTKKYTDPVELALDYYSVLFSLSGIHLTKSELSLVSFSAVKGTLSSPPIMEEFVKKFDISVGSVYNMISSLQKRKILTKDKEKKVRVSPSVIKDFSKPLTLLIEFNLEPVKQS